MSQQVFVCNKGSRTYVEKFNGETISIPPGGRIKMQRREAIRFLSQMSPYGLVSEGGSSIDMSKPAEKKLVIEPAGECTQEKRYICNLDGTEFNSQEELDRYLKTVSSKTVEKDELGNITRKRT